MVKVAEFPTLKMKDKGIPIENVSKFDGKTETILFMLPASGFTGKKFLIRDGPGGGEDRSGRGIYNGK